MLPSILHLPEVDSTNAEAMRRALAGAEPPLWIVAGRQTRGRGRSGRPWQSQFSGNLYASLLLRLGCPLEVAAQLSLVAGIAVIDAINSLRPAGGLPGLQLKWPNDILIGPAKAGGILIESSQQAAGHQAGALIAVIGIGINLIAAPDDTGRSVTSLNLHNIQATPDAMLDALRWHMDQWLSIWQGGAGFAICREAWLGRALMIGTELSVNAGSGPVSGRFAGLAGDGALLLQTSAGRIRFSFGDVTLGVA
jgi:BirA family transcriptional regulator, biotin operon repressor / biotin---[acetyl-CoA-carboxylase] ligase